MLLLAANFAKVDIKTTWYEPYIEPVGHLLFAVLTGMAVCFWQERTLILDAAFQSYLFIAKGSPAIMVERFGAVAVQVLPLAGVWAGASLSTVLLLYSVSIVLFHWTLFAICLYALKDRNSALAILLFNILLVGDSFYWMQNELLQAITLMFVLWSIWMRRGDWRRFTATDWGLSLLLATTVAYYHPLVFFPLAFVWCWTWLNPLRRISRPTLLLITFLFALVFSSKYIFRQPNFYDRGMTGQYVREFRFSMEKLLASHSFGDFVAHLSDNFLLLLPLLALVTGYYAIRKRWWSAALLPGAVLLYCLLIMQRFLADDRWYIQESHYQALAVFLIVPLVWEVLPAISGGNAEKKVRRYVGICMLALLLVYRLTGIWNMHHFYTTRLSYVKSLLESPRLSAGKKLVMAEQDADRRTLMMYWGLPYETLQITALQSPDSVRVIAIAANPDSLASRLSRDSMVSFLMIPPIAFDDWPKAYYYLSDSSFYRAVRLQ